MKQGSILRGVAAGLVLSLSAVGPTVAASNAEAIEAVGGDTLASCVKP